MIQSLTFVLGIALLVYSSGKLIGYLVGIASRWMVSLFLVAIVFTGVEFDDLAYGIVLNSDELKHAALGTVLGTTIALTGIVLALTALIAPCRVDVPKSYLALFVAAPVVLVPIALTGALTPATGIVLVALFVAFVTWIGYREYASRRPVFRNAALYEEIEKVGARAGGTPVPPTGDADDRAPSGPPAVDSGRAVGFEPPSDLCIDQGFLKARQRSLGVSFALAVLALAGLLTGATIAGQGTAGILDTFNIEGTVFGATVATLALSLEDLFLSVEPSRRGAPEIAVANIIGSVVFSLTGKLGIVLLVGGSITVDAGVLSWHFPVLLALTVLSALFLATGRLRRWHGAVLLALYAAYFITSIEVFGEIALDFD